MSPAPAPSSATSRPFAFTTRPRPYTPAEARPTPLALIFPILLCQRTALLPELTALAPDRAESAAKAFRPDLRYR